MKSQKKSHSKGISPLLASVLLIAITVAIATLTAGWVSTTVRTTQATITNKTTEAVDCSAAGIVIDDVYASSGTAVTARAIVRNTGQTDDLTITSAQLYNTTGANFTASSIPISNVDKGNVNTLSFSSASLAACPGSFSQVVVTTSCGGVSAVFDKAPKCP